MRAKKWFSNGSNEDDFSSAKFHLHQSMATSANQYKIVIVARCAFMLQIVAVDRQKAVLFLNCTK